jgi:hypothetical protein
MKKTISLVVVSLFVGIIATTMFGNDDRANSDDARAQFVGAWRLVSLEEEISGGKIQKTDCAGQFVFTSDGHLAVQVMFKNPPLAAANAAPLEYSQGGYEASFGTYVVDENAHIFTFHVEGAVVRALVGKDLKRVYEISGKQLIVKSANPDEHWKVVWEHY